MRRVFNSRLGLGLLGVYVAAHATLAIGVVSDLPILFAVSIILAVVLGWLIDASEARRHRLVYHFRVRGMQFAIFRIVTVAWALVTLVSAQVASLLVVLAVLGLLVARVLTERSISVSQKILVESRVPTPTETRSTSVLVAGSRKASLHATIGRAKRASSKWLERQRSGLRRRMHSGWILGDTGIAVGGALSVVGFSAGVGVAGTVAVTLVAFCVAIVASAWFVARTVNHNVPRYKSLADRAGALDDGSPIDTPNAVYFPSGKGAIYQLKAWTPVFEDLAETAPTTIVVRNLGTFAELTESTELPVIYARSYPEVQRLLQDSVHLEVVFYVNHDQLNYQPLRFANLYHVHIGHGESDKVYMASNQSRAYNFVFVAGRAAIDRHTANLMDYDGADLIEIGRPLADVGIASTSSRPTQVMYAPTYEGDLPGMRYTSVDLYGVDIVDSLIEAGHEVVYRPHPLTGRRDSEVRAADRRIREHIQTAGPPHLVDTQRSAQDALNETAVLVSDVSAMVVDFLATGRPYFVTVTDHQDANVTNHPPSLDTGYIIDGDNVESVGEAVSAVLNNDTLASSRAELADYYFGDRTPGESMRRFISAVDLVHAKRSRALGSDVGSGIAKRFQVPAQDQP